MFNWRADGTITDADDGFLQLIGYSREEMRAGQVEWPILTPPEYLAQDMRFLQKIVTQGHTGTFRKVLLDRNGRRLVVDVRAKLSHPGSREGFGAYSLCPVGTPEPGPENAGSDSTTPGESVSLKTMGIACALVSALIAATSALGWLVDNALLASYHPRFIPMAPLTAITMLLLVAALLCALRTRLNMSARLGIFLPALMVTLLGLRVLENFMQGSTGWIEEVLAPNAGTFGTVPVGRMSPLTATGLLLISAALMLRLKTGAFWRNLGGVASCCCIMLATVILLGYMYDAPLLYGGEIIPIALTTTLALLSLSVGTAIANGRDYFPLLPFSGASARAILLRAFLPLVPAVVLVDLLVGALLPQTNPAVHSALLVFASSAFAATVIYTTAARLGARMDEEHRRRREAELSLERHMHGMAKQASRLDLAHSAIMVRDLKGVIRFWSRGAERLYGYSREHALGRSAEQLLRPEYPTSLVEVEQEVLAQGAWAGEVVHYDATGKLRHMDARWSLERSVDGTPEAILEVNNDITEKREADAALRQQLRRNVLLNTLTRAIGERQDLRSVINVVLGQIEEHLPLEFSAITLFDSRTQELSTHLAGPKSVWCAETLRRPFARKEDLAHLVSVACQQGEVVYWSDTRRDSATLAQRFAQAGLCTVVVLPTVVASDVLGALVVARRSPGAFIEEELKFLQQLTEQLSLGVQASLLYQDLLSAYDELKRTQDAAMQQERLRALGQMASGIAHDINNALSPIVGYADLLLSGEIDLPEDIRQPLQTILTAANDIAATIARLRQFYRTPEQDEMRAPVLLPQIVEQAVQFMQPRWKSANEAADIRMDLQVEAQKDLPPILGMESELRDAMTNLLINALDAMPRGGKLELRVRQEGEFALVEVKDSGIGMDIETQRRCLEPFFTTKGDRGTGLGLGMVYGIVKRHAGMIHIDSRPGSGTTVTMSFPLASRAEFSRETPAFQAYPKGLRILVVDDEPTLRQLVREMLERDSHQVVTAKDGHAALAQFDAAIAQERAFDVVITDLGMPEMGGRRVAQLLKERQPAIPVVLLTGWGARMRAEHDKPAEVDIVLAKPPRLETLRGALAHVLQSRPDAMPEDGVEDDTVVPA